MTRQIRVYITAKREHAPLLRTLKTDGIHITSRWLWNESRGDVPVSHWLQENFIDAANADFFVLYCQKDDDLNGSLVELGNALSFNRQILLAGERDFEGNVGGLPHKDLKKWAGLTNVRVTGTLKATMFFIKKTVLEHPEHWRR